MITLASTLVALPVALTAYSYLLYPLALWVSGKGRPHAFRTSDRAWPLVTVVIPAYNEELQIAGAIEAVLAQDYPAELLQLLVLSDASTDGTDAIVTGYAGRGVELLRMPQRAGKTAAENASCGLIRGEIVVNTDASIRLHRSTVRELVLRMSDPTVGVASSRDESVSALHREANRAEAGYVGYEMMVRELETKAGGIIGASGSGYAIRAALHRLPIREDLSRDFSAALTAHKHGFRAVSVAEAICYVPRTAELAREYRRKVRTIARGMDTLYYNRALLNPVRHGAFAWKLLSHKLCRWLVPLSALLGVLGLMLLSVRYPLAFVPLALFAAAGITSLAVARAPEGTRVPRLASLIAFAFAANAAVVNASWRFAGGHDDHIWEPTRRAVATR